MRLKIALLIIISSILFACSSVGKNSVLSWKAVSGEVIADPHKRFVVKAPSGWIRRNDPNSLVLSRDGLGLQFIKAGAIRESDIQTSLRDVVRDKTKTLTLKGLLSSELADVMVYMFKDTKATRNLKIIANEPATVGTNIEAFRLLLEFRTNNGLRIRREVYGYAQDSELIFIMYQAPLLHFFAKDHPTFKNIVASFRHL